MKLLSRLFTRQSAAARRAMRDGKPGPAIIFPLYIYPDIGAWDALFEALKSYPALTFVLIINPHNGPGGSAPDENYSRELERLKLFSNAITIGYVRTDYCRRDMADVLEDVRTYASWSDEFKVNGIFFDETPNLEDEGKSVAVYLDKIAGAVKRNEGIGGEKLVITNPGTVPSLALESSNIDIWTVCEDSFQRWESKEVREWMATCKYPWGKCCYIVHSTPVANISPLVKELKVKGQYIFVTDLKTDFYAGFGRGWPDLCKAMLQ